MKSMPKWGFGMAPLKNAADEENRIALNNVRLFVIENKILHPNRFPNDISTVKGLFSRVIKQDQWDWFTINMYFDYPPIQDLRSIVSALSSLRTAIVKNDDKLGRSSLSQLQNSHFLNYCDNYLNFDINSDTASEYLYILSRREEKDILKIGMTTRNVQKRVNEINSATGVIYPLAARKVFKVKNSRLVEKEIHKLLSEYRMRADREFFMVDYSVACNIIDNYLTQNHLYYYE